MKISSFFLAPLEAHMASNYGYAQLLGLAEKKEVFASQQPIFHTDYPSEVNFGGLGTAAGHEISHGFDPDV